MSVFRFSAKGATLVSYVPERRKVVVLLSTQHRDDAVTSDNNRKPEISNYYNTTKCAVDCLHLFVKSSDCQSGHNRAAASVILY